MRLYLAAPTRSAATLTAAAAAFIAAGFLVTSATDAPTATADEFIAQVDADFAAIEAADAVVYTPGAEASPELVWASLHGVPVVALADALEALPDATV